MSMVVKKDIEKWELNLLNSIVSQLKVDIPIRHLQKMNGAHNEDSRRHVYKKMEVNGAKFINRKP